MKNIVVFKVHNSILAVETEKIHQIVSGTTITPIAGIKDCISGVFAFDGKAITAVNLKKMFFDNSEESQKMIILKTEKNNREILFAVSADRIVSTCDVDKSNLAKKALINKHIPDSVIEEIYSVNTYTAVQINTDKLYSYMQSLLADNTDLTLAGNNF